MLASYKKLAIHIVIITMSFVMLYPILWMLSSTLKPENLIFSELGLWSKEWDFSHYKEGWFGLPGVTFGLFIKNSLIVTAGAIIGNVVSCSLTAYAFARLKFRFKTVLFAVMLMSMMIPGHVTLIPQYIIFHKLELVNTFWPLIIPKLLATDGFFVFLIVQFIRGLPRELDEAATIDGCNLYQIYWRIIMPLTLPALVTTAIFTFTWTWDDFFNQLIYLNETSTFTVPLGLRLFMDSTSKSAWGPMFAMSIFSLIPSLIVFGTCQKYFIQGITTTGLKG